MAAVSGGVVALNTLCANNPPTPLDLNPEDFQNRPNPFSPSVAIQKVASNFQNSLWHFFCKCQDGPSGSPSPTPPPVVNWNQPTFYISNTTNQISNYDIAETLNFFINYYGGLSITNNYTGGAVSATHACSCPEYQHGTVHEGITGSGSLPIGGLVGMEVEVVGRPGDALVLPGQPEYLWDMGWMSIMNEDGMLEEKRITRAAYSWLPSAMRLASSWTYTLKPGVELRATELPAA